MVAVVGVTDQTRFANVHLRPTYTFYIVTCDINITNFDNAGVNSAWLGEYDFSGEDYYSPMGWLNKPVAAQRCQTALIICLPRTERDAAVGQSL